MIRMDKPTGRQIAAARALVGMTQPELADRSKVSVPTVKRMEGSAGPAVGMANNVDAVCRALEAAGVIFVDENGEGPGVRLRKSAAGGIVGNG
ncbi:helix-turn-helix domain-containing protein [Mesorhizobium sp. M0340]|uniref:helix-turn-helix domain-containing protein n=1 Tax=Mesorhizobium sp. M0340 TaxID=2956939 RepID=UPI00333DEF47